jgi:hypothetical protein
MASCNLVEYSAISVNFRYVAKANGRGRIVEL